MNFINIWSKVRKKNWLKTIQSNTFSIPLRTFTLFRHIEQLKKLFKHQIFYFEGNGSNQDDLVQYTAELIRSFRLLNNNPQRSQKLFVLGPPGSGRTELSKSLCQKYGLAYISTKELLTDLVAKKTKLGEISLNKIKQGDLVPDDIVLGLIKDRASRSDALIQGFVIDGFPKNATQLENLKKLNIIPSRIIVTECSDDTIHQRFQDKKTDPVTGIVYHQVNEIDDNQILKRLVRNPQDSIELVTKRNLRWKEMLKVLEAKFSDKIIKINTEKLNPNNPLEVASFNQENRIIVEENQ